MAYARSHTMTLLCAAKVRSRICVCGKDVYYGKNVPLFRIFGSGETNLQVSGVRSHT